MFTNEWIPGIHNAGEALELRKTVFEEELGWAHEDAFDWYDGIAVHLIVKLESCELLGAARIYPLPDSTRIDSICVPKPWRGQHFGDLCTRLLLFKAEQLEQKNITALVPKEMVPYYEGFGFAVVPGQTGELPRLLMQVEKGKVIWDSACKH